MHSKLKLGILSLVILLVVGIVGYKFVGNDSLSSDNVKQQNTVLNCVTDDPAVKSDKSLGTAPEKQVKSESPKSSDIATKQKDAKEAQSSSVAKSEEKPASKVAEENKESSKQPMWILFRSTTCLPCVEMQKTMDTIALEFQGKVKFVAIDVNDPGNMQLVREYKIQYIPTTYLYDKNEQVFFQQVGVISVEDMRTKLNALLEVK